MDAAEDDREVLETGRSSGPVWFVLLALVAAVVAAVVLGQQPAAPAPVPDPAPPSSPPPSPAADPGPDLPLADVGTLVPGADGELVHLRTETAVVTVDLGTGRTTRVPAVLGSRVAGSTLVAGEGGALLLEGGSPVGAALRVRDGYPTALSLVGSWEALPGPDGAIWRADGAGGSRTSYSLSDLDGRDLGGRLPAAGGQVLPDGRGGLLAVDRAGLWRLDEDGTRDQVSPGRLLATGRNHLLVSECGPWRYCVQVLVDQRSGEREVVRSWPRDAVGGGRLSPDGSRLAVVVPTGDRAELHLVPTRGGEPVALLDQQAALPVPSESTLAWSEDGSTLLAVYRGRLTLLRGEDGEVVVPALGEERVLQLAACDCSQ
ncbi:hypothetical protein [Auraticoccus monumenti]|uniref:WD40-like Beta Propeller Repeat n=1 Tax=Auraticoccus monumenti TaxID=675864 RepID=A0A1G7E7J2_9ACTN|nr:hypothetical protein [Auraticoccus monumenti]SDE59579.1 hypothetical protein SAMN04489747_3848 [Auraticoccus monumenti]